MMHLIIKTYDDDDEFDDEFDNKQFVDKKLDVEFEFELCL